MLPTDLSAILNGLDERLRALERTPQGTTITGSNSSSVSFNLAAGGSAGDTIVLPFTLSNVNDLYVGGWPRWDLWKNVDGAGDYVPGDLWPNGANWTDAERRSLDLIPRLARVGSYPGAGANDLVFELFIRNRGTSALTSLQVHCDWRLPLSEGTNSL